MTDKDYIKIPRAMFESDLFTNEPFSKMQAWLDLVFLALPEDKDFYMRGTLIHGKKGVAYISRGMLAKRWGWSDKKVVRFLDKLIATQLTTQPTTQPSSWLTSCVSIANYDTFTSNDPTYDPTNDPTSEVTTQLTTQLTTQPSNLVTSSNTTDCEADKKQTTQLTTQPTTQLGDVLQEKEENKETEKRKKNSPTPPIKEINKAKEKKEEKELRPTSDFGGDFILTREEPTEKRKPTKKEPQEYTLQKKATEYFDSYFKQKYGFAFNWHLKKEHACMKTLLNNIINQLKSAQQPYDDDNVILAFKHFIDWAVLDPQIEKNLTISNLVFNYTKVLIRIQNGTSVSKTTNNYGRYQSDYDRGRAQCEAIQQDFAAELAELEYKLATKQIIPPSEQPQGGRTEIELPDF